MTVPDTALPIPGAAPDDAALVARCRAGDEAAWGLLVARYQRLVFAIVRRMGDDEHVAADVFQTVFSRLLQHLPRLQEPARLQAWIVTTAKREALLQRQRARRTISMSGGDSDSSGDDRSPRLEWDLPDDAPGPDGALDELQQFHQVRQALDRMDERCRHLLQLLFRDDDDKLPYDEVGRRLGIPVGSIGPTRARCLDKLRRLTA